MSPPGGGPTLRIEALTVGYQSRGDWLPAVRDVSLTIDGGQTYGLVGESGSGKSTLALAVLRYLPVNGAILEGRIDLDGQDLAVLGDEALRQVWERALRLVPQNPLSALNPSLRVGDQIGEALDPALSTPERRAAVQRQLEQVQLADPERVAASYPHQLSGGMQQRVMLAMALSGSPRLIVLDEPTTNLDVTTQATILDLLDQIITRSDAAVLYVSHNLGVVAQICDRVAVLYAGELVEDAGVDALYEQPLHPYTRGLLDSVPRMGENRRAAQLRPIPGSIPQLSELPSGCVFAPRCPIAIERCSEVRPPLDEPLPGRHVRCHRWPEILAGEISPAQPEVVLPVAAESAGQEVVLTVDDLVKQFPVRRSVPDLLRRMPPRPIRAVDGVTLDVKRGRTLGLVGESGSGKSTIANCIIGLVERTSGEIQLFDMPLAPAVGQRSRETLSHLQMVFQNPEEALNPYRTIGQTLRRALQRLGGLSADEAEQGVVRLLESVRLPADFRFRMPGQLSGGEKQRVAIARAFASQPDLLIFDESVSALDASVQASILNLLTELQGDRENAYLFISHDLSVVSYLADEIAVVYLGHLMEVGSTAQIFEPPYHPYTEALLSAIPLVDPAAEQERIRLEGSVPSPRDVPSGCRFHTRCPRFLGEICVREAPPWQETEAGHRIYCHIPLGELETMQHRPFHFSKEGRA